MAPVDLNVEPEDEEEEAEEEEEGEGDEEDEEVEVEEEQVGLDLESELEAVAAAEFKAQAVLLEAKVESAQEMLQRDRDARMAAMKRRREEEEAKERKMAKKSSGSASKQQASAHPRQPSPLLDLPPTAADFSLEYAKARRGALTLPDGWLECPPIGEPLGQFIPAKTPLGESFKEAIEPGKRHSPATLVRNQKHKGREIGMVVDLTNTNRYYRDTEWREHNVKYVKLPCRGRNEVPDNATVNEFCFQVRNYFDVPGHQRKFVVVHCTHGHNRTGYMIINYIMRAEQMRAARAPGIAETPRVADVIQLFAQKRPPGIYKEEYIHALFSNYHERRPALLACPPTPEWKKELDLNGDGHGVEDEEDGLPPPPLDPTLGIVPAQEKLTNDDVLGDAIPEEQQGELQRVVFSLLGVDPQHRGRRLLFPGSQPVSLDRKNLKLLAVKYYYATWKADGMRYMILLLADGVYLIDRNFRFRRVQMRFPVKNSLFHPDKYGKVHHLTLLDGEMVIDSIDDPENPGRKVQKRRYLVYDLMALNGSRLSQGHFNSRWNLIQKEIIDPRQREQQTNKVYIYEEEPFKIRRKDFWPLNTTAKLLHNMIPKLSHEADGLILQAWDDHYVPRTHEGLLKWKYAHMNSVDFQLEVNPQGKHVLLLVDRGKPRMLEGAKVEFPEDVDTEELLKKVIECCYMGDNVWKYMRIRHDKEHPNAWHTYVKVKESITDNITEEVLLAEIDHITRLPLYQERLRIEQARASSHGHHHHQGHPAPRPHPPAVAGP